jgi:hypothetical protein
LQGRKGGLKIKVISHVSFLFFSLKKWHGISNAPIQGNKLNFFHM